LEFVAVSDLLLAEQEWIDSTACTDKSVGFNIRDTAESSGTFNAQIWEGFIDPNGNEVTILNLHDFRRQHNLDFPSMHRLSVGKSKLKSYKGWTHVNSVRQREYVKTYEGFIDPEGNLASPITNLAEFCRQHDLDDTHMLAVMRGRICSHRGWTHISGRKRQSSKTYTSFVNPQGERVLISNLAQFCRENGLHPVKMHHLKSGKIRRYKDWTWRNDDE
jgi:hypothetical protein